MSICLITSGLPSSNPRLVKEARALIDCGFRVHLVIADAASALRSYDDSLLADIGASFVRVPLGSGFLYKLRRIRQALAAKKSPSTAGEFSAAAAVSVLSHGLFKAARQFRADLYIGHTLGALPAAVWSAEANDSLAGFDAEDYHSQETGKPEYDAWAKRVEDLFLPRCVHRTAASPLIANRYRERFGEPFESVLNVFPLSSGMKARAPVDGEVVRLYWFSQTVGPGRGLEQIIAGAGLARTQTQLVLLGLVSESYREALLRLAQDAGILEPVFLPPTHPDDMIRHAAGNHIGLSLEIQTPPNRAICLTNKLFAYLAAGIPQIISQTPAQSALANELGKAAVLVDLDVHQDVAAAIDKLSDPICYDAARLHASDVFRQIYNWEAEQNVFIQSVRSCLNVASDSIPI